MYKQEELLSHLYDPSKIVANVHHMFKSKLLDKGLDFKVDLPIQPILVCGDKYKLTLVLINTVSNAIKFTHSGGISVSLHQQVEGENVTLYFKVTDSGIGIKKQELSKLFQPFSQANARIFAQYGGSGLGLQLCKKLVNLMGGDINLVSDGNGAVCSFHVVCKKTQLAEGSAVSATVNEIRTGTHTEVGKKRKRILIVEDNAINQKLLRRVLETENYPNECANNGKEAVEKVLSSVNTENAFQVVLMDLEMPIMNGLEATKKIREFEKHHPDVEPLLIIGVSANARESHMLSATEIGMNAYVTKPFQKKDIIDSIEVTLRC